MNILWTKIASAAVATTTAVTLTIGAATPAGSAASDPVAAQLASNPRHQYSGEEIFRALIFGQGRLVEELGELAPTMAQTPEVVQVTDAITQQIRITQPAFFAEFKRAVITGRAASVDAVLKEAGAHVASGLRALGYVDENRVAVPSISPRFAAVQVVLFAVAGIVVGVAAVLVTAAVATQTVMYSGRAAQASFSGVSLSHDRWVVEIAQAFE